MSVTQFKDITWGDESISTDKLNVMVSNTRYLFEQAPKLFFNSYGVKKASGIKIACGVATVPPNKNNAQFINVYFGNFFTPGSRPVIVTSITSPLNGRIIETIYGLSGLTSIPDHRGMGVRLCAVELTASSNYFIKTMYVNWIAMGY